MTGNLAINVTTNNENESEREKCSILKAEIVSCMTEEVKVKIGLKGYTPSEIATAYILRKFNCPDDDYRVVDPHSLNLKDEMSCPDYQSIIYNETGTAIVDIIF